MTKGEVIKLFAVIAAAYPRDKAFALADKQMVGVWHDMLWDVPYEASNKAVCAHIATSQFPPGISDIRGWAAKAAVPMIEAAEAWGKVMDAVRRYGFYQETEARRELQGPIWDAFERTFISWQHFCMSENVAADRAHFLRMWESMSKMIRECVALPDGGRIGINAGIAALPDGLVKS